MDHDDLYYKMRADLYQAKEEIISKLDTYQHRVTKLETEQGWIKRILIMILTTALGIGTYYIKKAEMASTQDRKETHEKIVRHPRKTSV